MHSDPCSLEKSFALGYDLLEKTLMLEKGHTFEAYLQANHKTTLSLWHLEKDHAVNFWGE